ncbi:polar amino acid transport system substrate-binding protein [Inhella inkyongensis]|uniref:Polar amino acid transport system substrate-binding protein n=1 Tax=Inhella inkyongensis TaxID=392593 RepID=A0A840SAK9_9BURK|nr:transporter substrate-binding domain-containing protein [Inhella inkyongensis]MBB5205824.1 polar amino acid transport system substrate-binding protein [Inhella inkyongensis]
MSTALPRRTLLLGGTAWTLGAAAQTPRLRLLSEDFPPVNFEAQGRPSGLAGELVLALQQRLGLDLPIEFMPWTRAYDLAQSAAPICLFTMARAAHREKLFKWVGPVVDFQNALFKRKDNPLQLKTLGDAAFAEGILVVREWASAQELQRRGFQNLVEVSQAGAALRMLVAGRAPLMAFELLTLPDLLKREGLPPDAVQAAHVYTGSLGYLAFSLATPDAEVRRWQLALDAMKRDGSFARLFKRWLPHMTPP